MNKDNVITIRGYRKNGINTRPVYDAVIEACGFGDFDGIAVVAYKKTHNGDMNAFVYIDGKDCYACHREFIENLNYLIGSKIENIAG